jgi:periplasmic protein TonB
VSDIRLPLILSVAGHAACLGLLALFLTNRAPAVPEATAKGGIEVVFEPAPPKLEAAPLSEPAPAPETPPEPQAAMEPPPPEPEAPVEPPPPEPPVVATEPAPPEPEAPVATAEPQPEPPPTPAEPRPRKPTVKKPPKPVQRRPEVSQASQTAFPVTSPQPAATPAAPPQTASAATSLPAPVPSPEASAGYRALLSHWLESHKRYPEGARQRGEEGRAVLRFEVDRSGRVLDYAVITSSGYPDLDQSIEDMMREATLPPFPAGMPQPRMEVSVTIRFSLRR